MMTAQRQSTGAGSMIVPPVSITKKKARKKGPQKVTTEKKTAVNKLMFGGAISQQKDGKQRVDANTGATIKRKEARTKSKSK